MIDPDTLDFDHPLADVEAIRRVNLQRFEMEQLTAILQLDPAAQRIVAYKDVGPHEFWVRGHMPEFPLMPGVIICEAAAQLASYFSRTQRILTGDFLAFGGMDNVKFRGMVRPGDRLVLAGRLTEHRVGRRATFHVQGIVGKTLVFHGDVIGVPVWIEEQKPREVAGQSARSP